MQNYPATVIFTLAFDPSGTLLAIQHIEEMEPGLGDIGTSVRMRLTRSGIGSTLMHWNLQLARTKAYRTINAEIRADNPTAQDCYYLHGFVQTGTLSRKASDGRAMAMIIARSAL